MYPAAVVRAVKTIFVRCIVRLPVFLALVASIFQVLRHEIIIVIVRRTVRVPFPLNFGGPILLVITIERLC